VIRFLQRILRYGAVGLIVSVAYSLAVVLIVGWLPSHDPVLASGMAFVVMLPIAYLAHRYVSFFDAERDSFQPLRFAITTSSTFLIAVGGMYWMTEILGRSYLLGIALNWALIPAVNFLIFFFWVFRVGGRAAVIASPGGSDGRSDGSVGFRA
jgi:putative flippase GtrA